ncbi:MAG TPA: DegT/DnrJ/EryC1/StrS family aminotransferase [Terriglobia bacterium]|nr:DegT/DnrJ/EryC1/StrS family aminotransferase [Terriglobia bacterium]
MSTLRVDFYGHVRQYHNLKNQIDAAIHEVLESGSYVLGPKLAQFEKELAQYCNMKEAVGLNSGTDALVLVLKALGIGPGDEVITTSNTFFATAEAVWLVGATPVFVDIEPKTCNIDPNLIEAAISPKTKAIIPVHLYGQPAEMRPISKIAKAHNLFVIEDCAQALGARGDDFAIGELSDAVCTSFIIQKNLGCFGDGGAVITNNSSLATEIRKLRNHGSLKRSHHSLGYNSRLDDIHAAVLSVKLKELDKWNDLRRERAKEYDAGLADTSLKLPTVRPGFRHIFHLYVVETEHRDELQSYLQSKGIRALTHYPIAIHQQEGYPWGQNARISGSLKHTERSAAQVLSLPMFPELTSEEVKIVVDEIKEWEKSRKAAKGSAKA